MQRAKGGADKNPTEKFNRKCYCRSIGPCVDGNNQVHWREMAQLYIPWDQETQKKKTKKERKVKKKRAKK